MTETMYEMIRRLSRGKGQCRCGAPAGDPCRNFSQMILPHSGRPELGLGSVPQDMSALGVPEVEQEGVLGYMTLAERATEARESENAARAQAARRKVVDGPERHELSAFGAQVLRDTEQAITPAEQRTGISDVQAAIVDEVESLRDLIGRYGGLIQDWRDGKLPTESEKGSMIRFGVLTAWEEIAKHLDRLAGMVPQLATDRSGQALWVHTGCGCVRSWSYEDLPKGGLWCADEDGQTTDWHALYTVARR